MKTFHMAVPGHETAALEGYLLDCELTLGQWENRPAVIVCPGGGYVYCSPREGEPVALRYCAKGFHAFVLRYSTGFDAKNFAPWKELDWVIGFIRENAHIWHVDAQKIAVCGFSAGGHLALASGLLGENKPNAMVLGYPAVQLPRMPGVDYMVKLLTGKEEVTEEDFRYMSLANHVTKDAPAMFLMATAEDMLTSFGSLPLINKYASLGLAYEAHIFQHGPHGYSLADETSAGGSSRMLNSAFAKWFDMSTDWLLRIFGPLEFKDKDTSQMRQVLADMGITLPTEEDIRHA